MSIAAVLLSAAAGCSNPSDTSGFKAEAKPSNEDVTRKIAQIKANPKIPAGIKAMALKRLEKQQADAH